MSTQPVGCRPACFVYNAEQTKFSCALRVTAAVSGVLILLLGVLVVAGVPGLNQLGTTAGGFSIGFGVLVALVGACVKCVIQTAGQRTGDSSSRPSHGIYDTYLDGYHGEAGSKTIGDKTTTTRTDYISSKTFVESKEPKDLAVMQTLKQRVGMEDLRGRLIENFGTDAVEIALPLHFANEIRHDDQLLHLLTLIFTTKETLLQMPLKSKWLSIEDNILRLRLNYIENVEGTLYPAGSMGELIHDKSPPKDPNNYIFMTDQQVISFLEQTKDLDEKTVEKLLPCPKGLTFIKERSYRLLKTLPKELVNKVVPYLSGDLLEFLIKKRGIELDFTQVTEGQVARLFPTSMFDESSTKRKLESLSIEILNQLLPKMESWQLRLIPGNHLSSRKLALKSVPEGKIKGMFSTSFFEESKSKERLGNLHSDNKAYVKGILKIT